MANAFDIFSEPNWKWPELDGVEFRSKNGTLPLRPLHKIGMFQVIIFFNENIFVLSREMKPKERLKFSSSSFLRAGC